MNSSGLCLCGCGMPTTIARNSDTKRGWIKGQPKDYVHGHYGAMTLSKQQQSETMQARRKRTQKQGPYKAGATMKAKVAVGKIEAAMKVRGHNEQ